MSNKVLLDCFRDTGNNGNNFHGKKKVPVKTKVYYYTMQ